MTSKSSGQSGQLVKELNPRRQTLGNMAGKIEGLLPPGKDPQEFGGKVVSPLVNLDLTELLARSTDSGYAIFCPPG